MTVLTQNPKFNSHYSWSNFHFGVLKFLNASKLQLKNWLNALTTNCKSYEKKKLNRSFFY